MPIATPEVYGEMLDRAKAGSFAYPAVNVTSSETLNAALRGFAEAESDGIIQFSTGGAEFASGSKIRDMLTGGTARPPSCARTCRSPPSCSRSAATRASSSRSRSVSSAVRRTASRPTSTTSSTPRRATTSTPWMSSVPASGGRYLLAARFGNVHGAHKPGNVRLRPEILRQGQKAASRKLGLPDGSKPFDLVFHGGSDSLLEEIHEALSYGVVKLNIDTDAQYAFTRPHARRLSW